MDTFFTTQHASLTALRREIHQHPELGFEEFQTAQRVKSLLTELDIPFVDNIGQTGIVATVTGNLPDNGCTL